ncbi:MAG: RNA methyltransferase [Burkholderiaceae bacterium]
MTVVRRIGSRHNDLLKDLRRLRSEPAAYRKLGRLWLEGDHLCRALVERGRRPLQAIVTESAWADAALNALARSAPEVVCIPDGLMRGLSDLESPAPIGFLIAAGAAVAPLPGVNTVVLDRLQDPGNVGSILRTASAMGCRQVIALKGGVALWSPKVLRAGMGAHFALTLTEGAAIADVAALGLPIVGTHLRDAQWLHEAALPDPLAWVFGHEGKGIADAVAEACALRVRIAQPGGEESLNVAAAAAVCLYESARSARPPRFDES